MDPNNLIDVAVTAQEKNDPDVEKVWEEFWLPVLTEDGPLDIQKFKRELYDFYQLMGNASKVYYEVTGGKVSKCNTRGSEVIRLFEDHVTEMVDEAVNEAIQEYKDGTQGD